MDFVKWLDEQSMKAWNVNYCIDDGATATPILKTLSSEYDWLYLDALAIKQQFPSNNAKQECKLLYDYLAELVTGNPAPKRYRLLRHHDLIEPALLAKGKVVLIVDNAHLLHRKTLYVLAADTKSFVESHQYLEPAEPENDVVLGYMRHPLTMMTLFVGNASLTTKMESKDLVDYLWRRPFMWDSSATMNPHSY